MVFATSVKCFFVMVFGWFVVKRLRSQSIHSVNDTFKGYKDCQHKQGEDNCRYHILKSVALNVSNKRHKQAGHCIYEDCRDKVWYNLV